MTSGFRSSGTTPSGAAIGSVAGASVIAPSFPSPGDVPAGLDGPGGLDGLDETVAAKRGGAADGELRGAEGATEGELRGSGTLGAPDGSAGGALSSGASLIRFVMGALVGPSGSAALSIVISPSAFTMSGGNATAVSAFS